MHAPLALAPPTLRIRLVGPDAPASVPWIEGHLHVGFLVHEEDGAERPVTEADLEAWETSAAELLRRARRRLIQDSAPQDWVPVDTVPGMALYQAMDGQSSSRILVLDHLVEDWPLAGIAVAVPSEDQLIAVPLHEMADLEALNVLITAAEVAHRAADRPLSDQAFWFDGAHWHHIEVIHGPDTVRVTLPAPTRAAVERLAAMGLVALAGEA